MDVTDATPIRVALPTPPTSPAYSPAAAPEEEGPSAPAEARPSPAATPHASPIPNQTSTPTATPANRQTTLGSPLGSTPTTPSPPPPVQSEEAPPLHILQLWSQLQRIEARQLHFQEETKVFLNALKNFLCFQFPSAAAFFTPQPVATPNANHSATTQPIPSANPSVPVGDTEEVHLSSDDKNDIFDWQSPRDRHNPRRPTPTRVEVPESSTA
ncbi:hypothetical protein V6N13_073912 [Hibiscus sabdariffa]